MTEFIPGNRLTLLDSGREYFPALLAAIAAARHEIFLESYIFADDAVGQAVIAALIAAAARGVRVHVVVDGFGARHFAATFGARLSAAQVQYHVYRQEARHLRLRRHRLRRLHRKLVAIDARVAFVGGINIIDDENAPAGLRPRYDYAVRIEGPLLKPIRDAMRRLWEVISWASLKRRHRLTGLLPDRLALRRAGKQRAAFLLRDNLRHRNDIANAYLAAIAGAGQEILIANAYFLPGRRFRRALAEAAQRGVTVRILLQGQSDHPFLHYATQALYGALLRQGVRIFEYKKSFLHAKVAVIDRHWSTVGSSNIDPFSLLLAKEANVAIDDHAFSATLKASLEKAMAEGAVERTLADLGRLPLHSRLLRWLAYGLVRLLMGMAGYGPSQSEAQPSAATAGRAAGE